MDSILTEFIQRSKADPALAQDLLEATEWNMEAALLAYESLQETRVVEPPEYEYNPRDFDSIQVTREEDITDFVPENLSFDDVRGVEENEIKRREVVRKKKLSKRSCGLSFADADEVIMKFNQVAVSKQKVSSKEQVIIDEKFFQHSFIYPDFSSEGDEMIEYIALDLLETSHKRALENSGRLNWWTSTGRLPRLEPLATSGDGNCLLHAASLYMWGLHDHFLILRTALHRLLTVGLEKEGLKRRWKYQTQLRNEAAGGLTFSEEEWEFEWEEILRIATNRPRQIPTTDSLRRYSTLRVSYESLEEIHISVLAHTLRRPIIVLADRTIKNLSGEDLAPIYFGGIYLPLEVNPTACYKSPVVLAYDSSHFSPLVARQDGCEQGKQQHQRSKFARLNSRIETVIPLVSPDGSLLPVQFIYDPSRKNVQEKWSRMEYKVGEFPDEIIRLLENYLNLRWIQLKVTSSLDTDDSSHKFPIEIPQIRFPAASIAKEMQPIYQKELVEKYLEHIKVKFQEEAEVKAQREAQREEEERKRQQNKVVACEGEGCDMFGRSATNNLCSKCYQKSLLNPQPSSSSPPPPLTEMAWCQDDSDEVDVANLHRAFGSQKTSEKLVFESGGVSSGGGEEEEESHITISQGVQGHHESPKNVPPTPVDSIPAMDTKHVLVDQTNRPPAPSLRCQTSLTEETRSRDDVPALQQASKKPLIPPEKSPSTDTSSLQEFRSSKSRSPTPPAQPALPLQPKKTKASSPVKSRGGVLPPLVPPDTQTHPSTSPKKTQEPKQPASRNWTTSSFVPSILKRASKSPNRAGGYSRDNILPLHLDPTTTQGNSSEDEEAGTRAGVVAAGVGTGGGVVTVTSIKKKCITVSCEFFGSSNSRGYCSGCFKKLCDNTSSV